MNDDSVEQDAGDDDTIDDAEALLERVRMQVQSAASDAEGNSSKASSASTGLSLRRRSNRRHRFLVAGLSLAALTLVSAAIVTAVLASRDGEPVAIADAARAAQQEAIETLRPMDDDTGSVTTPTTSMRANGEPASTAAGTPPSPTSAPSTSASESLPVTRSPAATTEVLPTQPTTTTESTETSEHQTDSSDLPDKPEVRLAEVYIGARKTVIASWSRRNAGPELTGWQVELDDKVLEFSPEVDQLEWEPLASGQVTARVRGVSDAGYGDWGTASFDVVLPRVVTSAGDPGPTEVFDEEDSPCDGANRTCRWIQVNVSGFPEGRYLGLCFHDGFRWANGEEIAPQQFGDFWIDVDHDGRSKIHSPCYMTFSHVLGRGVQMAVELNGELVYSDWFTL